MLLKVLSKKATCSDWIALHALGMIYLRRGKAAQALELFEQGKSSPFRQCIPFFRSGCAMAQLALKQPKNAKLEIETIPAGSHELNRAVRLLNAHIHGDLGEPDNVKTILADITAGQINKDEKALVDVLSQTYLNEQRSNQHINAANDNLMELETIIMFRAIREEFRLLRAA